MGSFLNKLINSCFKFPLILLFGAIYNIFVARIILLHAYPLGASVLWRHLLNVLNQVGFDRPHQVVLSKNLKLHFGPLTFLSQGQWISLNFLHFGLLYLFEVLHVYFVNIGDNALGLLILLSTLRANRSLPTLGWLFSVVHESERGPLGRHPAWYTVVLAVHFSFDVVIIGDLRRIYAPAHTGERCYAILGPAFVDTWLYFGKVVLRLFHPISRV